MPDDHPKQPPEPPGAIFLFATTHDAMGAEEAIIDAGFWCDVVPRPPGTGGTLCGLAIEVQAGDRAEVENLLIAAGIEHELYQPAKT